MAEEEPEELLIEINKRVERAPKEKEMPIETDPEEEYLTKMIFEITTLK